MRRPSKYSIILILLVGYMISTEGCRQVQYSQGEKLYLNLCSSCHMEDGSGLGKLIPNLNTSISKSMPIMDQICKIKNGFRADSLGEVMRVMPSFSKIKTADLTNLVNYINHRWNPKFKEISMNQVSSIFDKCH